MSTENVEQVNLGEENLVLWARSPVSMAFSVDMSSGFGVVEYSRDRNSKSQISNIKWFDKLTTLSQVEGQITITNPPPADQTCFGRLVLEFEICL